MSQPDKRKLHLDTFLTNNSVAYMNDTEDFIADKVFPMVSVESPSDIYPVYSIDSFMRARAQVRVKGEESAGDGWDIDITNTYQAIRRDFHHDIDYDDEATVDTVFDLDEDAMEYIMNSMLLTKEEGWMTNYFATGVWGVDKAGVGSGPTGTQFLQWDVAGSNPVSDIRIAADAIQRRSGKRPNTLVVSPPVMTALEENAAIVSRIQHTFGGSITTEMLAKLLRIDRVFIANAVHDNSNAGASSESMAFMSGDDGALLCYSAPKPGKKTPSAGYTFAWNLPESGLPISITKFPMRHLNADRVEGSMAYDHKVIAPTLGTFFATVLAG